VGSVQRPSSCVDRRRGVWETTGGSEYRPPNSDSRRRGVMGDSGSRRDPDKQAMTAGVMVGPRHKSNDRRGGGAGAGGCRNTPAIATPPPRTNRTHLHPQRSEQSRPRLSPHRRGPQAPAAATVVAASAVAMLRTCASETAQVRTSARGRSAARMGGCGRREDQRKQVGGQRLVVGSARQAEASEWQGQTSGGSRRLTETGGSWRQVDCGGS